LTINGFLERNLRLDGSKDKFKARLVIHGYKKEKEVDSFLSLFSAV